MQDGAYKVVSTTNEDAKQEIIGEIINGVSNASYGELAIIYGLTELTPEQRALIVKNHKMLKLLYYHYHFMEMTYHWKSIVQIKKDIQLEKVKSR